MDRPLIGCKNTIFDKNHQTFKEKLILRKQEIVKKAEDEAYGKEREAR